MTVEEVRRILYKTQRAIGDAQALDRDIKSGSAYPRHLTKRVVRRHVTRALLKPYGKAWRQI